MLTLAGDWDVARMLADMPFPLTAELARSWARSAAEDRSHAITLDGRMIGGVSVCPIENSHFTAAAELGFWLGSRGGVAALRAKQLELLSPITF